MSSLPAIPDNLDAVARELRRLEREGRYEELFAIAKSAVESGQKELAAAAFYRGIRAGGDDGSFGGWDYFTWDAGPLEPFNIDDLSREAATVTHRETGLEANWDERYFHSVMLDVLDEGVRIAESTPGADAAKIAAFRRAVAPAFSAPSMQGRLNHLWPLTGGDVGNWAFEEDSQHFLLGLGSWDDFYDAPEPREDSILKMTWNVARIAGIPPGPANVALHEGAVRGALEYLLGLRPLRVSPSAYQSEQETEPEFWLGTVLVGAASLAALFFFLRR